MKSIHLIFVVLVVTVGCGEPEEQTPSHTLFGRLSSTTANPSGKVGVVKVVGPSETITNNALYSALCDFVGPSCEYRIHFVLEGNYTVFALIDMNDTVSYDNLNPDSGDLITHGRALILWDKTEFNFTDEVWHAMP